MLDNLLRQIDIEVRLITKRRRRFLHIEHLANRRVYELRKIRVRHEQLFLSGEELGAVAAGERCVNRW